MERVLAQIRSRRPPGNRAHADRGRGRVVAGRGGIERAAGRAELLRDDQVVGRLLAELHELDVAGIGTRTTWIATK